MYDFGDVRTASRNEQIRAYSVERAVDVLGLGASCDSVVNASKMIEQFIVNGDTSSTITEAVEEGYREGRFEVKEAVEAWFTDVDLSDMFLDKGWIPRTSEKEN